MSFSITTLRGFINKINQAGGGSAPEAPVFSYSVGCYGMYGTISTATEGATIRWTNDGSDPTCSTGNEIACSTAIIVPADQIPGSCEDIIPITSSPSSTLVKAIACLDGVASSITSSEVAYTCPTSIDPPVIEASCPDGESGMGCNCCGGVDYTVTPPNVCGTTYIRYGYDQSPDYTVSDTNFDLAIDGLTTFNLYDFNAFQSPAPTWVTAIHIDNNYNCNVSSTVAYLSYGYLIY